MTKSQVIQKLGICTRQLCQVQMEKDVAISKVVCLVKKVTQSKDIVTELRICLQNAQGELRSTRSSDRHHCHKLSKIVNITTEIIEATEWNHQCALNSITKLATEQLAAKDKEHVLSLNEKNNEIRVSECHAHYCTLPVAPVNSPISCQTLVKKNEKQNRKDTKQKHKDTKLHKKLQVSKDKKYSQLLAANEKKYSTLASDLHQHFNNQLRQSAEKVLAAT
jgi:hypothetical protein